MKKEETKITKKQKLTVALSASIVLALTACGKDSPQPDSDSKNETIESITNYNTQDVSDVTPETIPNVVPESTEPASESDVTDNSDTSALPEYSGKISDRTFYMATLKESLWEEPKWIEFGESEYGEVIWTYTKSNMYQYGCESYYTSEDGKNLYVVYTGSGLGILVWEGDNSSSPLYKATDDAVKWKTD